MLLQQIQELLFKPEPWLHQMASLRVPSLVVRPPPRWWEAIGQKHRKLMARHR